MPLFVARIVVLLAIVMCSRSLHFIPPLVAVLIAINFADDHISKRKDRRD